MRFCHLFFNALYAFFAKKTVGIRVLILNKDKVLLVKHTYQTGWYAIGGGIDPGETPQEAAKRELKEEVGVTLTGPLELFNIYYSHNQKRDDYIIFYISHESTQEKIISSEISEQQWFPLNQLPKDISPATNRRIQEYLGKIELEERW